MAQAQAQGLRVVTSRRQDFDSYFPLDNDDPVYETEFASLPFPAPLTSLRASFRGDDFECDAFLVEHQKHGQLDDLRLELRGLSALLESELVEGVEEDYEAFIGLGKMDSRKVDELTRGVNSVADQVRRIEEDVRENLKEVEGTLAARRELRRKKKHARASLRVSRGVDELAFILTEGEETDLESAVEAFEQVQSLTQKTPVPEYDTSRYSDLQMTLQVALRRSITSSAQHGDTNLVDTAALLRRFQKALS